MNDKIKLKDACKILNGFAFKSGKYVDSGIRIIRIANVQKGHVEDERPVFYPNSEESSIRDYMLEEDDLLLSLTGNVGRVALLDKRWLPAALNQRVACLRIKDDRIIKDYLYFALLSDKFENDCTESSKGIAQKNMSTEWLKDYEIPLPSVQKQREITSSLKQLSMIIKNKTEQIQQLDILIKARFVEMFKGKYDLFKVGEKLKTTSGGTPKSSISDYYDGGDIPWLTSGEINYGNIIKPSYFITEKGLDNSSAKWVPKNSIVIAMYGATAGKVGIVRYKTTTNQAVCSVLPNDNFNQEFMRYAFQDISEELTSKTIGGGQPNISQTIIKNSYIVDVPIEEQERFASFSKQVDKSKFVLSNELTMCNFYIRLIHDRVMHSCINLRVTQ